MSKIGYAIHEIHYVDEMAERDTWIVKVHPLSKVIVTLLYLVLVMSFPAEELTGLGAMVIYLIIMFTIADIPFKRACSRLRYVLIAIALLGIVNPFFDQKVMFYVAGLAITEGMITMVSLFLKAGFAVFASYLLFMTTSMEQICYALRIIHIPQILVTLFMLIYRYIIMMLKQTQRMTQAYSLRAPGQKGVHYKAWGSMAGQLLLRSIDQAQLVYESMTLRGFNGEYYTNCKIDKRDRSIVYALIWIIVLLLLRFFPVFELVGGLI